VINEFSAKAKASNNNARVAFFTLLSAGIVSALVYMIVPVYKGIVGLVVVALLTAAVLIYTRYIAPIYYYDITSDYEGTPIFVVRQVTGKRETTLARISLADITAVKLEGADERRAHKTEMGVRKYFYTPTLSPDVTCRISARSRYEKSEVVIEVTEEFAEMLRAYAAEARELRAAADAEDEY